MSHAPSYYTCSNCQTRNIRFGSLITCSGCNYEFDGSNWVPIPPPPPRPPPPSSISCYNSHERINFGDFACCMECNNVFSGSSQIPNPLLTPRTRTWPTQPPPPPPLPPLPFHPSPSILFGTIFQFQAPPWRALPPQLSTAWNEVIWLGNEDNRIAYEAMIEDFTELVNLEDRRGAPPAAKSAIEALETFQVGSSSSKEEEEREILVCAVCKDTMVIGDVGKKLPCRHCYHENCIVPWLRRRNSCPVCRFQLLTDDAQYERTKHLLD